MPCEASTMPTLDSSDPCSNEFADQHIHGLAGVDFATSRTSDIRAALELLRTRRTTQVTASIPTVQQPDIPAILDRLRSEEHTSELQSRFDLVCRLLLEKKK